MKGDAGDDNEVRRCSHGDIMVMMIKVLTTIFLGPIFKIKQHAQLD